MGGRNELTEVGMGSHVRHELHIPPLKSGPFAVEGGDREVLVLVSMKEGLEDRLVRRDRWDERWLLDVNMVVLGGRLLGKHFFGGSLEAEVRGKGAVDIRDWTAGLIRQSRDALEDRFELRIRLGPSCLDL